MKPLIDSTLTFSLALAVFLNTQTAAADDRLSRPMNTDGRVLIEASNGAFRITGNDDAQLHILVSEDLGDSVQIEGDEAYWKLRFPATRQASAGSVEISLPATAEVEARVDAASLTVLGLHGPRLALQSVSGPIRVNSSQPRRLSVETVDGPLTLNSLGAIESRIRSMGGAIDAVGTSERARLRTVSGPVKLDLEAFSELELESLSGTLDARLAPREEAMIRALTHSGAQRLDLPATSGLDLRAESHLGQIRSDFGGEASAGPSSNRRLVHRNGNGRVQAELRSIDGPIEIRASQPMARVLVFRDPSAGRSRLRKTRINHDIEVGADGTVRASLSPGQFALFDLPLDSRQFFARHSRMDLKVEMEMIDLSPDLYCFRISRVERWPGTQDLYPYQIGFEMARAPCPAADELAEFEQVDSGTEPEK